MSSDSSSHSVITYIDYFKELHPGKLYSIAQDGMRQDGRERIENFWKKHFRRGNLLSIYKIVAWI